MREGEREKKKKTRHVHTCKSVQHFNPINNGEVHIESFHLGPNSAQHVKRELKCLNPLLSLSSSQSSRFTWFHFITISKGARAQQRIKTNACVRASASLTDWIVYASTLTAIEVHRQWTRTMCYCERTHNISIARAMKTREISPLCSFLRFCFHPTNESPKRSQYYY